MLQQTFGPVGEWPDQDLIGFSTEFDAELAIASYQCGVFPMPLTGGFRGSDMGWWSPIDRAVLPLGGLRVTKSMRQSARKYTTTIDRAFPDVIAACANPDRPGGWIDSDVLRVYTEMHKRGVVHSVETWDASGVLVGGLYGVSLGGLFAGESMFHDEAIGRDASKVALMRLVRELLLARAELLDVQWLTPHLATLGAVELDRLEFLGLLSDALESPTPNWREVGGELSGDALAAGFTG